MVGLHASSTALLAGGIIASYIASVVDGVGVMRSIQRGGGGGGEGGGGGRRAASAVASPIEMARMRRRREGKDEGVVTSSSSSSSSSPSSPHRDHHRRRDDRHLEFDGTYSVRFSECVDVKLVDDELFNEDLIEYTKAGQVVSTRSYVLFRMCQDGDDCGANDDDDLYLLDMSTYVRNVASYHASARGEYCDACDSYYQGLCASDGGGSTTDDDAMAYYDGDDASRVLLPGAGDARRLRRRRRRRETSYVSCAQCESYGCTGSGDDDGYDAASASASDGAVIDMIEGLSDCLSTGINWNGNDLYVGYMCGPYGDGVELAIFLDDRCTVYTNQKSFADVPSYYVYNSEGIFTMAETHIKEAFTKTMSCTKVEYGDPNDGGDDAVNADANEFCASIFQSEPMSFDGCEYDDQGDNGDNANYQNAVDDIFSFYDYDMNRDDYGDLSEVCTVLKLMDGEYSHYYDSEKSGSWNNHGSGKSGGGSVSGSRVGTWHFLGDGDKSPGLIAICLYVLLGIVAFALVLFAIGYYVRRRRAKLTAPIYECNSFGRLV
jgi:hypothetical protein